MQQTTITLTEVIRPDRFQKPVRSKIKKSETFVSDF